MPANSVLAGFFIGGMVPIYNDELKLFSGNANRDLAELIAKALDSKVAHGQVNNFSDGETWVEITENVRGDDIFIIQPTCAPANNHIMELLIMIDAMKRASAGRITAVIPYYGYARQDRKVLPRTPISSKLVADLLTSAGTNRILTMDLHAGQIQGFFNIPVDHLNAKPVLIEYVKNEFNNNLVIVSPDAGGAERAREFAKVLHCPMAMIDKRRTKPNESEVMHVIGDVKDRRAIIIDDIIDTGGTMVKGANALLQSGAKEVFACCTHAVLSGKAIENLENSCLEKLIVTDTIPLSENARNCQKIKVLTVSKLLAEAIRRIHAADSVSSLFL